MTGIFFLRASRLSITLLLATLYSALITPVYAGPERLEVTPVPDLSYLRFNVKVVGWDFNDSRENPLYGCKYHSRTQCTLQIGYRTGKSGNGEVFGSVFYPKYITEAKTIGELGRALFSDGQWVNKEFTGPILRDNKNEICFYVGYMINGGLSGGTPFDGWDTNFCATPEISQSTCSLSKDVIELAHGPLTENNVNGNTVSAVTYVKCTFPLNVRIFSKSDTDHLSLGNTISSKVTANGKSLKDGVPLKANASGTPLVLVSQLSASNPKPGNYQTSFDMIVSLP